jgi:hypothetical protein
MKRGRSPGRKRKEERPREQQIWITHPLGYLVCDSLTDATLYASREAGIPLSEWQVAAALRSGRRLCAMAFSYTKPEATGEKRPALLRRNQLEEGSGDWH